MSIVRLKRLQADYLKLQDYVCRHPRVQLVQADGDPPERYQLRYQVNSLRQKDDRLVRAEDHLVEVTLPRNYPRVPPVCRMLTPVFHPNIAPHAVCIGDHWSAGESLPSLVARIGEMLAYQSYNTKSPLNGEAARWAEGHQDQLPLDPVSMMLDESAPPPDLGPPAAFAKDVPMVTAVPEPEVPVVRPVEDEPAAPLPLPPAQGGSAEQGGGSPASETDHGEPAPTELDYYLMPCPACRAVLKVPPEALGRTARCPKCKEPVRVPAVIDS